MRTYAVCTRPGSDWSCTTCAKRVQTQYKEAADKAASQRLWADLNAKAAAATAGLHVETQQGAALGRMRATRANGDSLAQQQQQNLQQQQQLSATLGDVTGQLDAHARAIAQPGDAAPVTGRMHADAAVARQPLQELPLRRCPAVAVAAHAVEGGAPTETADAHIAAVLDLLALPSEEVPDSMPPPQSPVPKRAHGHEEDGGAPLDGEKGLHGRPGAGRSMHALSCMCMAGLFATRCMQRAAGP